jgi:Fe-S-cluster-containing dehydrogenase component
MLENRWTLPPRTIFTYNSDAHPFLPVTHLSMACNHCEKPACSYSCPAKAFYTESASGVILVDELKCIGCRYCKWNCPYDAPLFDKTKGVIMKCNLCPQRLMEGLTPACASACPTGALNYNEIPEIHEGKPSSWFPETDMNPAIRIKSAAKPGRPVIIPGSGFSRDISVMEKGGKSVLSEWSLIGFTSLVTLSVALLITSFISGLPADIVLFFTLTLLAGLVSLFHLGKLFRAWRSLANFAASPLSREIAMYLIYLVISSAAVISENPGFTLAACLAGLLLLTAIDNVYTFTDRRIEMKLHSGQTFLTCLIVASFLAGFVYSFLFIGIIKLVSAIRYIAGNNDGPGNIWLRFFRIAMLIISGASMVTGISYPGPVIAGLFLSGEFIDRVLYYYDFNPLNINTLIVKQINSDLNETKRG